MGKTFADHNMALGDPARARKRHNNLFKYRGGLKEFPFRLRQQMSRDKAPG